MATIDYKGSKINYESYGIGEKIPLVLLHGFLEDLGIWDPIVKELKKERQVICIDLPGHGKSEGIADIHPMKLMADVVREVVHMLELPEISIAGHSMGGYVCLEFMKNFPMILKSLMLINSTPVEDSVEKQEIRERSVKLVAENKKAYINIAISNLFSESSKEVYVSEIEILKSRAMKMEVRNIQAALMGMKIRTNYLKELERFPRQKIIVASQDDPILEIRELEGISRATGCELYRLKNGHNSYLEDQSNLVQKIHFID
ncbi:alpha/beta fold hydrolase [Gramella sp. KN1008]|uniref:alpha/beta fold hydrolase n=1 Tax=Gramella sp. KN1008 TaxID=2529298 RepID=UPI001040B36F|nr:alpha/beta hydrolase [Gramella sp. KN1008]TBW27871.1 alpha/beta fold hydrolase [Gramella sp. KN1008]